MGSIGPHGIRCCFCFLSQIDLSEICDALPRWRSTKLRKSQVTWKSSLLSALSNAKSNFILGSIGPHGRQRVKLKRAEVKMQVQSFERQKLFRIRHNSNLYYTRYITLKRVTSLKLLSSCHWAWGQTQLCMKKCRISDKTFAALYLISSASIRTSDLFSRTPKARQTGITRL